MKTSFEALQIEEHLITGLKKQGIITPTPIQSLVYPVFLQNKNLIVESHTGSGKTLAFLLPLFHKIDLSLKNTQAIILAPTHELALQINDQLKLLAQNSDCPIHSALIMGDVHMDYQIKKLKNKPEIIIGSPGRILDLISKKKINSSTIRSIVLDEADNLLLHNQGATVKKLLYTLNPDCQITLFSASLGEHLDKLSLPLLKDPEILRTAPSTTLNPLISHYYMKGEHRQKFELLKKILQATHAQKALVFVSQHTDTKVLVEKLTYHGFTVATISGKLGKEDRKKALTAFRLGKVNVLLSSDLSARGLDIPYISHIIHYDLPLTPEDYLHRAGRTARNQTPGTSVCIMTSKDLGMLRILERRYAIAIHELILTQGKLKDLSLGTFLKPETIIIPPASQPSKTRNKYPKGFNSDKKKSVTPSLEKKPSTDAPQQKVPEEGTLSDALRLIAQSDFDY